MRKSFPRRVSFAATAHVHLFDKETDEEDEAKQIQNKELLDTLAQFHPSNNK
jgi:hypothetical protein